MQYYFIGGLGGNGYHLAPLIEGLGDVYKRQPIGK